MAMVRTFVAVDCSQQLRAACGKAIDALSEVVDGVRWVHPENLHLTLKFLGDVEDRELHAVCQRVARAVASCEPFEVACRSLGAFPSVDRPNTIWVGVMDDEGQLVDLHARLEDELAELGFPAERRPHKPHLTLGRTKSRRFQRPEWNATLERFQDQGFGGLEVEKVVVYSSELQRSGPLYTPLAHIALGEQNR